MMKQYIAPEALIVTFNAESRFALTISKWETGASGMESNTRFKDEFWYEDFDEFDEFDE